MTIFTGKTVEEAINKGLTALNLTQAQAEFTVIQTPKTSFFGLKKREAAVEVKALVVVEQDPEPAEVAPDKPTAKPELKQPIVLPSVAPAFETNPKIAAVPADESDRTRRHEEAFAGMVDYLRDIIEELHIDASVQSTLTHKRGLVAITTDQEALLIGKHGRTINALQDLTRIYLNHHQAPHLTVELNVGDYRERRQATVTHLAENTAREVVASGKPIYLDPMPAFERKQIHETLADNEFVTTYSTGKEPHRAVVIAPE